MLRDTESVVADEVSEILTAYKERSSQDNTQQEAMMAEMEKKMALLDAKIADFVGKAKENEAQAELHLAKAEEIKKGELREKV
jgi:DNA-binding transcriptional MerR regulator